MDAQWHLFRVGVITPPPAPNPNPVIHQYISKKSSIYDLP